MSKLIEDRIREKVRKIAILPENAICMNCTNKSQFVVMQYRIFICNVCVDAHRQCGHKGVQSVSFSTFSKEDLESLLSGGNEVGRRLYLPPNFNDSMKIQAKKYDGNIQGHKDAVVRFIQTMYSQPTEGGQQEAKIQFARYVQKYHLELRIHQTHILVASTPIIIQKFQGNCCVFDIE